MPHTSKSLQRAEATSYPNHFLQWPASVSDASLLVVKGSNAYSEVSQHYAVKNLTQHHPKHKIYLGVVLHLLPLLPRSMARQSSGWFVTPPTTTAAQTPYPSPISTRCCEPSPHVLCSSQQVERCFQVQGYPAGQHFHRQLWAHEAVRLWGGPYVLCLLQQAEKYMQVQGYQAGKHFHWR